MKHLSIVFMLLFVGFDRVCYAEEVAVVLSRQAGPYMEALKSFQTSASFKFTVYEMQGDTQKGQEIIRQLVGEKCPLLVTIGSEATLLAKQLPAGTALVYSMVFDMVECGGKNTSGVYIRIPVEKQLATLQRIFPSRKRIGVIYGMQFSSGDIITARKVTEKMGLKLMPLAVESSEQIPGAVSKLDSSSVDLIWMVTDALVSNPQAVELFIRHSQTQNIPLIGCSVYHVKAGAMLAFSADYGDIGNQTLELVTAVKNGKAANRIEGPRKVIIFVNSEVQKRMGINDLISVPEIQIVQ